MGGTIKQHAAALPLSREVTNRLALKAWIYAGSFSLWFIFMTAIGVFHVNEEPWVGVGVVALVVSSIFLYTLPSMIACVSEHPNRVAICFVDWFLGWTVLGWLIAMIWSLTGISARNAAAKAATAAVAAIPAAQPAPVEEEAPIDMEKLQALARAPLPVPMPMPVALKPDKSLVRMGVVGGIVLLGLVGILAALQFTHSPANIVDGPDYLKAKSASQVHAPLDSADATTSKKLNAEGLRLLSATRPDFSEAKRTFEKAVQLDSSNIEALNNLGYVYSRIGDYHSAEAVLLKVLAVAPTRRVAHGNLGYAQAKLGKTQEAVNHYCQYVRQFDSLERGKSALVRVNAADPDPNVQAAIEATVANCTR